MFAKIAILRYMLLVNEFDGVNLVKDLTIAEAQIVLDVTRQTLLSWIKSGHIKASKSAGIKGPWLIPAEEVEAKRIERIAALQQEIDALSKSVEEFLAQ